MPYIKHLTIVLKSTKSLIEIFKIMLNLEELNISMERNFINLDFEDVHLLNIPKTLKKLYLQFEIDFQDDQPSIEKIKIFLSLFQNQLESLTLIGINTKNKSSNFNKFHSLMSDMTKLQAFQYYIYTNNEPDQYFSSVDCSSDSSKTFILLPKPQLLDDYVKQKCGFTLHYHHNSPITRQQALKCTILNINTFDYWRSSTPSTDSVIQVNLVKLHFSKLIEYLVKLSKFFPNLKCLTLRRFYFHDDIHSTILIDVIRNLKRHFPGITQLNLLDFDNRDVFKNYKQALDIIQQQNNSLYYTEETEHWKDSTGYGEVVYGESYFLYIWL
ncbi:unnamed protein product [Rotaria sp. Silwood1]|nr:unnamed protein product [Rotaria sp. Silwood1]